MSLFVAGAVFGESWIEHAALRAVTHARKLPPVSESMSRQVSVKHVGICWLRSMTDDAGKQSLGALVWQA